MKNALISPNESVNYISSWTTKAPIQPIFTTIPNAQRVAEVSDTIFEVSPALRWVPCEDNVVADRWYYDSETSSFIAVPEPVLPPELEQPVVQGAQTL